MIIVPANTLAAGGFSVDNSCRFNDGDSSKMLKAMGTATNNLKFTFNCWFKRGIIGTNQVFAHARDGTSGPYFNMMIGSDDKLRAYGPDKDGGNDFDYKTNRVLRDVGAWYCVTIAMDTSLGAAGDRLRIYINGVEETSFTTETNPAQNIIYVGNYTGYDFGIGANLDNSAYWDGYIAEAVMIDGLQLTAASFGEFDEDSPTIWKPKDVSGLTFGNNGFYLDFKDSANLGNDANGGTDFTETNLAATDQTTDTPTNNFCTMNPLDNFYVAATFSEGNNQIVIASGIKTYATGTMGVSTGKWYWEVEMDAYSGSSDDYQAVGICDRVSTSNNTDSYAAGYPANFVYTSEGTFKESGTTNTIATVDSYAPNDIVGVALDLDNNKLYFSKNGTWQDSGDPTSGATGTGAMDVIATSHASSSGFYFPLIGSDTTARGATWKCNFGGSPAFTVSSGNADGNGYGNFEYAVPANYYSINTKNLAEYG
jgi:hypothetical protein|tara:strand:+ start:146 stop:1588 length:1443 start_codon:yes stop_codon:yes gene_type:complete